MVFDPDYVAQSGIPQPSGVRDDALFYGISWDELNTQIIRKRPVIRVTPQGSSITTGYQMQILRARVLEHRARGMGHGAENDAPEGIIDNRTFLLDCNFYTDPTPSAQKTDIQLEDRISFIHLGVSLDCRVADIHDAGGQGHHISGSLTWKSPSGD